MIEVDLRCKNNTLWSFKLYETFKEGFYKMDLVSLLETVHIYAGYSKELITLLNPIFDYKSHLYYKNTLYFHIYCQQNLVRFIGYTENLTKHTGYTKKRMLKKKIYFSQQEIQKLKAKLAPVLLEYTLTKAINLDKET